MKEYWEPTQGRGTASQAVRGMKPAFEWRNQTRADHSATTQQLSQLATHRAQQDGVPVRWRANGPKRYQATPWVSCPRKMASAPRFPPRFARPPRTAGDSGPYLDLRRVTQWCSTQ